MNRCRIEDDKLLVYVDPARNPTSDFVQVCLYNYYHNTYEGSMMPAIETIAKNKEFCLVFTPTDYIALADILDKYLTYNLEQARMIINWIDCYVRDRDDATVDWATVYLEILEGASRRVSHVE